MSFITMMKTHCKCQQRVVSDKVSIKVQSQWISGDDYFKVPANFTAPSGLSRPHNLSNWANVFVTKCHVNPPVIGSKCYINSKYILKKPTFSLHQRHFNLLWNS